MNTIFKTWKKATYLEGCFSLRGKNNNWASPIDFPTVLTAYGKAIRSGNWKSCTAINTPDYVIDRYFDTIGHEAHHEMGLLWEATKKLENITWKDVEKNEENVLKLIETANNELLKLKQL